MSRIHEYLPETLKDVIDLRLLNEDLDIELEQLDGYIAGIGKEVIVKSASLYGIEKWEKALGITPKDGDSLETRRFRVNNLLTSKLPYTYRWLIQKLTQITGSPSGYTLNINQADYAITIVLSGLDTNMMIEVQKQLRNAIPSNMVLEIGGSPLVSADIKVGMALRIGTKYKIPSGYGNGASLIPIGKNWFPPVPGATRSGVTLEVDAESGEYILNGTAKNNTSFYITNLGYTAGTYTLSANNDQTLNDRCYINIETVNGNKPLILTIANTHRTYNCDKINALSIVIGSGTVCNNYRFKPQLEKGTQATEFEPFIGL